MDLINKWLAGNRNYHVGVVLYNKFGKDEKLKKYFEGVPDKLKQDKLATELQALSKKSPALLQVKKVDKDGEEMPKSGDPVLEAMRQEWLPLFQKMQYLRHDLDKYEGNGAKEVGIRSKIAGEILQLEQQCMAIWKKRDYYLENGRLPDVKEKNDPLPDDPAALGLMIEGVKRNIRRNLKLAKDNPDNPNYPLRAREYQDQLDRILKTIEDGKH